MKLLHCKLEGVKERQKAESKLQEYVRAPLNIKND